MKYNEYLNISKLFESEHVKSYGYTLENWIKLNNNDKVEEIQHINEFLGLTGGLLNKIGLGNAASLIGTGIGFRKSLLSLGVKSLHMKKLAKEAKKFKEQAEETLKKSYRKFYNAKNQIKENAKQAGQLSEKQQKEINQIEKKITDIFKETIDKLSKIKGDQINKIIDNNKLLSDADKTALKWTWESLSTEVRVGLYSDLMVSGAVESDEIKKSLNKSIEEKNKEEKEKVEKRKNIFEKIKINKEEDKKDTGDKKEVEEKTKTIEPNKFYLYTSAQGKKGYILVKKVMGDKMEIANVLNTKDNITINKDSDKIGKEISKETVQKHIAKVKENKKSKEKTKTT